MTKNDNANAIASVASLIVYHIECCQFSSFFLVHFDIVFAPNVSAVIQFFDRESWKSFFSTQKKKKKNKMEFHSPFLMIWIIFLFFFLHFIIIIIFFRHQMMWNDECPHRPCICMCGLTKNTFFFIWMIEQIK